MTARPQVQRNSSIAMERNPASGIPSTDEFRGSVFGDLDVDNPYFAQKAVAGEERRARHWKKYAYNLFDYLWVKLAYPAKHQLVMSLLIVYINTIILVVYTYLFTKFSSGYVRLNFFFMDDDREVGHHPQYIKLPQGQEGTCKWVPSVLETMQLSYTLQFAILVGAVALFINHLFWMLRLDRSLSALYYVIAPEGMNQYALPGGWKDWTADHAGQGTTARLILDLPDSLLGARERQLKNYQERLFEHSAFVWIESIQFDKILAEVDIILKPDWIILSKIKAKKATLDKLQAKNMRNFELELHWDLAIHHQLDEWVQTSTDKIEELEKKITDWRDLRRLILPANNPEVPRDPSDILSDENITQKKQFLDNKHANLLLKRYRYTKTEYETNLAAYEASHAADKSASGLDASRKEFVDAQNDFRQLSLKLDGVYREAALGADSLDFAFTSDGGEKRLVFHQSEKVEVRAPGLELISAFYGNTANPRQRDVLPELRSIMEDDRIELDPGMHWERLFPNVEDAAQTLSVRPLVYLKPLEYDQITIVFMGADYRSKHEHENCCRRANKKTCATFYFWQRLWLETVGGTVPYTLKGLLMSFYNASLFYGWSAVAFGFVYSYALLMANVTTSIFIQYPMESPLSDDKFDDFSYSLKDIEPLNSILVNAVCAIFIMAALLGIVYLWVHASYWFFNRANCFLTGFKPTRTIFHRVPVKKTPSKTSSNVDILEVEERHTFAVKNMWFQRYSKILMAVLAVHMDAMLFYIIQDTSLFDVECDLRSDFAPQPDLLFQCSTMIGGGVFELRQQFRNVRFGDFNSSGAPGSYEFTERQFLGVWCSGDECHKCPKFDEEAFEKEFPSNFENFASVPGYNTEEWNTCRGIPECARACGTDDEWIEMFLQTKTYCEWWLDGTAMTMAFICLAIGTLSHLYVTHKEETAGAALEELEEIPKKPLGLVPIVTHSYTSKEVAQLELQRFLRRDWTIEYVNDSFEGKLTVNQNSNGVIAFGIIQKRDQQAIDTEVLGEELLSRVAAPSIGNAPRHLWVQVLVTNYSNQGHWENLNLETVEDTEYILFMVAADKGSANFGEVIRHEFATNRKSPLLTFPQEPEYTSLGLDVRGIDALEFVYNGPNELTVKATADREAEVIWVVLDDQHDISTDVLQDLYQTGRHIEIPGLIKIGEKVKVEEGIEFEINPQIEPGTRYSMFILPFGMLNSSAVVPNSSDKIYELMGKLTKIFITKTP